VSLDLIQPVALAGVVLAGRAPKAFLVQTVGRYTISHNRSRSIRFREPGVGAAWTGRRR